MAATSDVTRAIEYAKNVIRGKIVAGKYIRASCKQFLSEIDEQKSKAFPFYFDRQAAQAALNFIQELHHPKGEWASRHEKIRLEPWQCFFVANIFGWYSRETDWRRYRRALLFVARKNAKTTLAAAIGLYMLCADGEFGAEIYSGATSEKQAWEVFGAAKFMAEQNDALREYFGLTPNASNLAVPATNSKFETLIGKPGEGANPYCAIHDEYHEHKTNAQVFSMKQGMGARQSPLQLIITTAGEDLNSPCYGMITEAKNILDGVYEDESFFPLLYCRDDGNENLGEPGDAWDSITAMKKANPNLGISVYVQGLKDELREAKRDPEKESAYRTKKLNEFVGAKKAYFSIARWNEAADPGIKPEDFAEYPAIIAVDLASKIDIAALELLFMLGHNDIGQETYARFGWYYCPEETVTEGNNPKYRQWAEHGWLTPTDGQIIDFNLIQEKIETLVHDFQILEVAFDPFQATMIINNLMDKQIPCVEVPAQVKYFSDPMKTQQALILSGNIKHNGDPVYTWMLGNVVAKMDAKDNVYPRKERDENKIDGPVATIMALGRSMKHEAADMSGIVNPVTIKL